VSLVCTGEGGGAATQHSMHTKQANNQAKQRSRAPLRASQGSLVVSSRHPGAGPLRLGHALPLSPALPPRLLVINRGC
jgi:hypothetical protein